MGKKNKPSKPHTVDRYRKVKVRMWGDEKFRQLSPIPPCGQGLWIYLITGPHTGSIPGLFRAGRASLSEELDWPLEAFDKAFREAFRLGMVKADFKARVVWVAKAFENNKPESPNVVTSWAQQFELIPECPLKLEAYECLKSHVYGLGPAFSNAFEKAIRKPLVKAIDKAMPNQEQEQEQDTGTVSGFTPLASQEAKSAPEEFDLLGTIKPPDAPAEFIRIPIVGGEFVVDEDYVAELERAFPALDVRQRLNAIRLWNLDKASDRKTAAGVRRHITAWLDKDQNNPKMHVKGGGANVVQINAQQRLEASNREVMRDWVPPEFRNES